MPSMKLKMLTSATIQNSENTTLSHTASIESPNSSRQGAGGGDDGYRHQDLKDEFLNPGNVIDVIHQTRQRQPQHRNQQYGAGPGTHGPQGDPQHHQHDGDRDTSSRHRGITVQASRPRCIHDAPPLQPAAHQPGRRDRCRE